MGTALPSEWNIFTEMRRVRRLEATAGKHGFKVNIVAGDTPNGFWFGEQGTVVAGTVFLDEDGNHHHLTSTEPGEAGQTLYLDINHNGALDAGEPTATTNHLGRYRFSSQPAGSYDVRIEGSQKRRRQPTPCCSHRFSGSCHIALLHQPGQRQVFRHGRKGPD